MLAYVCNFTSFQKFIYWWMIFVPIGDIWKREPPTKSLSGRAIWKSPRVGTYSRHRDHQRHWWIVVVAIWGWRGHQSQPRTHSKVRSSHLFYPVELYQKCPRTEKVLENCSYTFACILAEMPQMFEIWRWRRWKGGPKRCMHWQPWTRSCLGSKRLSFATSTWGSASGTPARLLDGTTWPRLTSRTRLDSTTLSGSFQSLLTDTPSWSCLPPADTSRWTILLPKLLSIRTYSCLLFSLTTNSPVGCVEGPLRLFGPGKSCQPSRGWKMRCRRQDVPCSHEVRLVISRVGTCTITSHTDTHWLGFFLGTWWPALSLVKERAWPQRSLSNSTKRLMSLTSAPSRMNSKNKEYEFTKKKINFTPTDCTASLSATGEHWRPSRPWSTLYKQDTQPPDIRLRFSCSFPGLPGDLDRKVETANANPKLNKYSLGWVHCISW